MRAFAFLLVSTGVFAAPPGLRLPPEVKPTRVALDLTIDPGKPEFSGTAGIDLDVTKPTSIVWLNATDLQIDEAKFRVGGRTLPAKVVAGGEDFVGFEAPLPAGRARLEVRYRGKIDAVRSRAIYRVDEGADAYVYTNFEPIDARRAFPCFDEPSFKVPWQLTFHVPKAMMAIGNTPEVATSAEGERLRVELAPTRPLPSYLVAFVVGPFDLVDAGRVGRAHSVLRFIVPHGRGPETRWAKEVTPRIVEHLEGYFDMDYPFEKLDVAVVPRYWGTMEHPGIVALGQPLTLIRPDEESLQRRQAYANIAIHELGHYWFGDYVTCRWWDDTWLNESLGTWLDGKITDRVEPDWKWQPRHYVQRLMAALETDALPTAQALHLRVEDKNSIENSFDGAITYNKGSSLVRMIEHWMGESVLREAIQRYLRAHAWGNASAGDFLAALGNEGAAESFRSFAEKPGAPLISVEKVCDKTPHLVISQQRFLSAGPTANKKRDGSLWTVPMILEWEGGAKRLLLKEARVEVPLDHCPAWVMPNSGAFGYYRTRWDRASLDAIRPELPRRQFAERILLADDVAALAEEGSLPLADALALQPALLADPELAVLRRGISLFRLLHRDQLDDALRARFDQAVKKLLQPRAASFTFAVAEGEDPELPATRQAAFQLLGRIAGDARIVSQARAAVERWLADRRALSADLVDVALQISAGNGDAAWFERLLGEARRARDRRERAQLLSALGGFRSPPLAERAFALVRGSEFDLRDTTGILYLQLRDRETRAAAWKRLTAGWDAIVARMRDDESLWLVGDIAADVCDPAERAQVAAFLGAHTANRVGATHSLAVGLDAADVCIAAVARNRTATAAFLKSF